jgi:hypothetical protein
VRRPGRTLPAWGTTGRSREQEPDNDEGVSAPLDLNPLRAAGWIFRDGDCIAIERQSEELGSRVLVD